MCLPLFIFIRIIEMKYFLKKTFLVLPFLVFGLLSGFSCQKNDGTTDPGMIDKTSIESTDTLYTYTNPVGGITNIGDPYVMKYHNKYYLYPTRGSLSFKVWESNNLVDWNSDGTAFNNSSAGNNWGTGNFWAPEVKYINGTFFMVYSAARADGIMKVRIATSVSPTGPFINYSAPFFDDDQFSYIDGDIFVDGSNYYLYYVKDCSTNIINGNHVSQVFVVQLTSDLKAAATEPRMVIEPSQDWEGTAGDYQWNEGPFVMMYNGRYYLLYSANYFASRDYSVGYATAENPFGPWTKASENPILAKNDFLKVSGPGHCCVTVSPDSSEFFIVYHTHTFYENPSGNRNVCIDRLQFDNGKIRVIGPTRTAQPLPSGDDPRIIQNTK